MMIFYNLNIMRDKYNLERWLNTPSVGYEKTVRPHYSEDGVVLRMRKNELVFHVIIPLKYLRSAEDWRFVVSIYLLQMRRAIRNSYE